MPRTVLFCGKFFRLSIARRSKALETHRKKVGVAVAPSNSGCQKNPGEVSEGLYPPLTPRDF